MRPEEIRKLVGGYATGTLTAEERRALLEAALLDQDLFNELARDQALKDLLEDPQARGRLLRALEQRPSLATAFRAWLRRPLTWAAAGSLAAAAVLLLVFTRQPAVPPKPEPVVMAKRQELPEMPPPAATPPAPARTVKKTPPAPAESKSVPAEKVKVEVAAAEPVYVERAKVKVAPPEPVRVEMADKAPELERLATGQVAVRASAALSTFRQAEADALSSPIPYRVLRADAAGDFRDTAATALFALDDRLRVIFEPAQTGRLRVVSSSAQVLLDREVESSASVPLDVPPGETRLTGAFREIPFEILLRRRP